MAASRSKPDYLKVVPPPADVPQLPEEPRTGTYDREKLRSPGVYLSQDPEITYVPSQQHESRMMALAALVKASILQDRLFGRTEEERQPWADIVGQLMQPTFEKFFINWRKIYEEEEERPGYKKLLLKERLADRLNANGGQRFSRSKGGIWRVERAEQDMLEYSNPLVAAVEEKNGKIPPISDKTAIREKVSLFEVFSGFKISG